MFTISCKNDDETILKKSEEFEIDFGQAATFEDGNFIIKFAELIEDSRCPLDAICMWEGRAKVRIEINESDNLTNIILGTENSVDLDSLLKVIYNDFEIELLHINPHPLGIGGGIPDSDYKVGFTINDL